jgi:hypothetical protein
MTGEECNCDCHNTIDGMEINHIIACCSQCPHCHRNITYFWFDNHVFHCSMRKSPVLDTELDNYII